MKPLREKTCRFLLPALFAASLASCAARPQTIGELIDRSGQNPDRLGLRRSDATAHDQPPEQNSATAIHHYEQILALNSAPETRVEALRRAADLRIQAADEGRGDDRDLHRAIALYQLLLREFPTYPNNDHVLYQLARAQQLRGNDEASIDGLRLLTQQYPDSSRAADASFRAAEMLFIRQRYDEAAEAYENVAARGAATPYFNMAQYKYAWAHYQLGNVEVAVPALIRLLDQQLSAPQATLEDQLAQLPVKDRELTRDALRLLCLSLAAVDGGRSISRYFSSGATPGLRATAPPEPPYYTAVYAQLGALLLEKRRYTDAAAVFEHFAQSHPTHTLAPRFAARAIEAYDRGGFSQPALRAREDFANRYTPRAAYWKGAIPPLELMSELRGYMGDIARQHHAEAQQLPASNEKYQRFARAAEWYQHLLNTFPEDSQRPRLNLRLADALFDSGQTRLAAQQYAITAYDYNGFDGATDAALAAIKAWRKLADEVPTAQRDTTLREAIAASRQLADVFPQHPQKVAVLLGAAEDLYSMADYPAAVETARLLLNDQNSAPVGEIQRKTLSIVADAYFALENYPAAEHHYAQLLALVEPGDTLWGVAQERQSLAVYRQAEAADNTGNKRLAANLFQRAAELNPRSTLAANANYDAAAILFELHDWRATCHALIQFRQRFPDHALIADADKLLAAALEHNQQPTAAAKVYTRIAERRGEAESTRRSASLLAAQLYDRAGDVAQAATAYENHLQRFPQPIQEALQTRRRLADIASIQQQTRHYHYWLTAIIDTEQGAGETRTDATRSLAAQASLELALDEVAKANAIALRYPIASSLARRKQAMETAIASLNRAATYGIADITTAATSELGGLYRDFANALIATPSPPLSGDALEQYQLMLEEQAYPFEEKAITAFEANLKRLQQGLWNRGIRDSVTALADMVPARYGKSWIAEDNYDSLD